MLRGRYYGHYGQRRRRGGADVYTVMLLAQLLQRIGALEHKPPVTLAVMAGCFLTFFQDILPWPIRARIPSVRSACIQPYLILQNRQWSRLIWAAFLHADEMHLYYNMSSLLWKGVQLEQRHGSVKFAALLGEMLLLSHGMFVAIAAVAAHYVPEYGHLYLSNCAIGISAVLFALKVVLNHDAPGYSNVWGITLPTKYMAWAELFLASLFNPQASFLGHLAGILAGLLHVRLLAPAAATLQRQWRQAALNARIRMRPGQARYAAAGDARVGQTTAAVGSSRQGGAAAVAAEQRTTARSSRGNTDTLSQRSRTPAAAIAPPVTRQHQQQQAGPESSGHTLTDAAQAAPLSAEELRLRRLQRFGGL